MTKVTAMKVSSSPVLMRIGELSRQSNLPVKTLRYYEELGLIQSQTRTEGGFRQFLPDCIPRLDFIKQAKSLGLSLQEIRHILDIHDQGEKPCREVRHTLQEKVEEIEQRIQELTQLKGHLNRLLAYDEESKPDSATICPIIEQS
jgi:MerR family copper efflux transcriptional regulator